LKDKELRIEVGLTLEEYRGIFRERHGRVWGQELPPCIECKGVLECSRRLVKGKREYKCKRWKEYLRKVDNPS